MEKAYLLRYSVHIERLTTSQIGYIWNSLIRSAEDKYEALTLTETASLISAMTCRRSFLLSDRPWRRLPERLWAEQLMSSLR